MIDKIRKYGLSAAIGLFTTYHLGSAGYILLKATLAQALIAHAWHASIVEKTHVKPWEWADTYPIAKLTFADDTHYVLAGSSGRVLAFGPGHMSQTPLPGETGNTVIAGHRDTQFAKLANTQLGDLIHIETHVKNVKYAVVDMRVIHETDMQILAAHSENTISLVTCYPFDSAFPDTEWRYVVVARMQSKQVAESSSHQLGHAGYI